MTRPTPEVSGFWVSDFIIIILGQSEFIKNMAEGNCFGSKAICEFILHANRTYLDKGLKNSLKTIGYDYDNYRNLMNKFRDLIIVHLKFKKPHMDVVDAKYTLLDKGPNHLLFLMTDLHNNYNLLF